MPTITRIAILSLFTGALGCGVPEDVSNQEDVPAQSEVVQRIEQGQVIFTRRLHSIQTLNASNNRTLTLGVWECTTGDTPQAHNSLGCGVDDGYMVVGGSATTGSPEPGAFLTASYPNDSLTTWNANSKDHGVSCPHILTVFVHGIKISGLTKSELFAASRLFKKTSIQEAHPHLPVEPVLNGNMRIAVGAKLDYGTGPGSLLTGLWLTEVKGKDHVYSSPATITLYQIELPKNLPAFAGKLVAEEVQTAGAWVDNGKAFAGGVQRRDFWVLAGAYAFAVYNNPGRMLMKYGYTPGRSASVGYEVTTKDHEFPASGQALNAGTYLQLQ